ncbi:MAG: PilZ domain-containing protein [Planctomycetes bacterium]|nr:PilZ domain-containing protein [Planctomycetota bacterium]
MADRVKERRSKPRIETNLDASVTTPDSGFEATVKNMSMSGLLLICDRPVPEMTIVGMRLSLPARPDRKLPSFAFDITGAVVRCQPCTPRSKRYELAVFLTDMPRETRAALHEFIQSNMR